MNGGDFEIEIGVAFLSQMRRQNKNTGTTAYGVRGLSFVLPKVQIYLCDSFQK